MFIKLIPFFIFAFLIQAKANPGIDVGYTTITDTYSQASSGSYKTSLYNLSLFLGLDRADRFMLGWTLLGGSFVETVSGATTSVTTSDNGPTLLWNITKAKTWTLSYTYGMTSKASYSLSSTTETWTGTSSLMELGYTTPLNETISLGLRLSYYSVNSSKKIVTTTITDVAYTRTLMLPMIYFSWRPN